MTVTRGLEGVVATSSSISSIIDDTLTYVGYNIDDLTENASFEEVVYLLWHRKLPTKSQLDKLKRNLQKMLNFPKLFLNTSNIIPLIKFIQWLPCVPLFPYWLYMMKKRI